MKGFFLGFNRTGSAGLVRLTAGEFLGAHFDETTRLMGYLQWLLREARECYVSKAHMMGQKAPEMAPPRLKVRGPLQVN